MRQASQKRIQVEDLLTARFPGALVPRSQLEPERISCNGTVVDELLGGGLAVGSLTEFVGPQCSGRTTAALAYVRAVTNAGGVCAWIDVADALDPESVAANGVDLERLLWVRCSSAAQNHLRPPAEHQQTLCEPGGSLQMEPRHAGGSSPHPRYELRDMPHAIGVMLPAAGKETRREKRSIGTPGMPNRPLMKGSEDREEQVNSDRLPPRRGDNLAIAGRLKAKQLPNSQRGRIDQAVPASQTREATSPWKALDHALRAADLLLQGGGFAVIVLDLGDVLPEHAWKIPLATWFRFRAACERTQASLLLLTQHACARSSTEAVVRMQSGTMDANGKVMTGMRYHATTERSRSYEGKSRIVPIRKPPQAERAGTTPGLGWKSGAAWMAAG